MQWESYAYADGVREKARLDASDAQKLQQENNRIEGGSRTNPKKGRSVQQAWSNKVDARERRDLRREKKARKRAYLEIQGKDNASAIEEQGDDMDDLAREERAAKRVRKGKMGADQFELEFEAQG